MIFVLVVVCIWSSIAVANCVARLRQERDDVERWLSEEQPFWAALRNPEGLHRAEP